MCRDRNHWCPSCEEFACERCNYCITCNAELQQAEALKWQITAETPCSNCHTACPTCNTPIQPDIRVCPKCIDGWIGGNGFAFLDKATATIRTENERLRAQLKQAKQAYDDLCSSLAYKDMQDLKDRLAIAEQGCWLTRLKRLFGNKRPYEPKY